MASKNTGVYDQTIGGTQTAIGITAPTVINPRRCILYTINVVAPGNAGNLVINDVATLDGANEANQMLVFSFASLVAAGPLVKLAWPMQSGIVVSAVPTGAVLNFAFTYGPYGQ
jgi:hypothetical protein